MLKKLALVAVLVPFATVPAFAQATRAEVKAEAASANKSGAIGKGDEMKAPKSKSTAARADVKTEAKAANKAGDIATGEEAGKMEKSKSTKARADVKGEAKAAEKSGAIQKGEAQKP